MSYDIDSNRYRNQTTGDRKRLLYEEKYVDLAYYSGDNNLEMLKLAELVVDKGLAEELDPRATIPLSPVEMIMRIDNESRNERVKAEYNELLPEVKNILGILSSRRFEYLDNRNQTQKLLDALEKESPAYRQLLYILCNKPEKTKEDIDIIGQYFWLFPKTEILQAYLKGSPSFLEKLNDLYTNKKINEQDFQELASWFHSASTTEIAMSMLQVKLYAKSFKEIKNSIEAKKVNPDLVIFYSINNSLKKQKLGEFMKCKNPTFILMEYIMKPLIEQYNKMKADIDNLIKATDPSKINLSHFHPLAIDPSQKDDKKV